MCKTRTLEEEKKDNLDIIERLKVSELIPTEEIRQSLIKSREKLQEWLNTCNPDRLFPIDNDGVTLEDNRIVNYANKVGDSEIDKKLFQDAEYWISSRSEEPYLRVVELKDGTLQVIESINIHGPTPTPDYKPLVKGKECIIMLKEGTCDSEGDPADLYVKDFIWESEGQVFYEMNDIDEGDPRFIRMDASHNKAEPEETIEE
jgi:hypothetical protein